MPCTPCELCFLLFITHYYHWPTLHVLHLLHLRDCVECVCVSVRLCASVWRNMVKCICICTRLSLSAMRANSLRQIKQSPFFAGRVKLARRMPLKKKKRKETSTRTVRHSVFRHFCFISVFISLFRLSTITKNPLAQIRWKIGAICFIYEWFGTRSENGERRR